jgi:type II secretory ATPase GspE/PulE/Tfp pilus assembly ATPase PilB-like protein
VISTVHADTALQTFERLKSLMPSERERASTFTLAQQVRAIINQRLVKTLCQGCAHQGRAGDALNEDEIYQLGIESTEIIRRRNTSGCDLCNRTGISGRTLLLDALLITLGPADRDKVYRALMQNVNSIVEEEGVIVHTRRNGLIDLVTNGLVDPKSALNYLES